ncbi:MAG: hypothetical protein V3U07_05155 [Nitrospirales bacterium]
MFKKHALAKAQGPPAAPAFAGAASRRQIGLLSCSRTHLYAPRAKSPAALPEERRVLARPGWVGETVVFLNIPSGYWSSVE